MEGRERICQKHNVWAFLLYLVLMMCAVLLCRKMCPLIVVTRANDLYSSPSFSTAFVADPSVCTCPWCICVMCINHVLCQGLFGWFNMFLSRCEILDDCVDRFTVNMWFPWWDVAGSTNWMDCIWKLSLCCLRMYLLYLYNLDLLSLLPGQPFILLFIGFYDSDLNLMPCIMNLKSRGLY